MNSVKKLKETRFKLLKTSKVAISSTEDQIKVKKC